MVPVTAYQGSHAMHVAGKVRGCFFSTTFGKHLDSVTELWFSILQAPLQNLAGFVEGFYEFPNGAGVAHRTTAPLNIFAKNKESSHFQRNKPWIPVKQ